MASSYGAVPQPEETHLRGGYGGTNEFAKGNPTEASPLSQSLGQQSQFHEEVDDSQRGSSTADHGYKQRSASSGSTAVNNTTPSRSGTLKKKNSVKRNMSLKRSDSRKSLRAGSIRGLVFGDDKQDESSIFYTPIPTTGSPTEVLADRFQAWRQLLKSLITYFREVQASYEHRSKALHKLHNTVTNITYPTGFISSSGLGEATRLLDDFHKRSINESNKSREIEEDVIGALTGLRADLGQKIKEIKSLSGDFKNSVEKEREATLKEVDKLKSALEQADLNGDVAMGKNDPFVVRLGVDRAVEKQIDEENYLHRAYLNLESSGRELETIVVGEIQKAYKALAGILRREGDEAYNTVESLRAGPISMPKDQEWTEFVHNDAHFVSPDVPLRRIEEIYYPGKDNPAAAEIRAGMLERKSKYLKSYSAGWYVLSPTHLHEFKSADKIYTQPPIMSLYLGDQRLGSHSEMSSSSHKFMLKGRQAGGMHKGHNWVFRAESHDTMLAWFNDIKTLTEGTAGERSAFVRKHTRSASNASERPRSFSSDGFDDDDADAVPYSADAASLAEQHPVEQRPQRPVPGGRFPSDIQVPRATPLSPSSDISEPEIVPAVITSPVQEYERRGTNPYALEGVDTGSRSVSGATAEPERPSIEQSSVPDTIEDVATPILAASAIGAGSAAVASKRKEQPPLAEDAVEQDTAKVLVEPPRAAYDSTPVPVKPHQAALDSTPIPVQPQHAALDSTPVPVEPTQKALDNTPVLASIAPPLSEPEREPAATLTPAPVITPETLPVRPTASVLPTPDAPADRSTSTTAVKNAELVSEPPTTIAKQSESTLGGLERVGAHETGRLPKVIRHDTDISVSKLHVPGEFR